jgi:hypothetical protein
MAIDFDFVRAKCRQMRSRIGPRADHDWEYEARAAEQDAIEARAAELTEEAMAGAHSVAVIEYDYDVGAGALVHDLVHLLTCAHDRTWAGEDRLTRMRAEWRKRCEAWAQAEAEREFGA